MATGEILQHKQRQVLLFAHCKIAKPGGLHRQRWQKYREYRVRIGMFILYCTEFL
jgi:hypothetical protein